MQENQARLSAACGTDPVLRCSAIITRPIFMLTFRFSIPLFYQDTTLFVEGGRRSFHHTHLSFWWSNHKWLARHLGESSEC